METEINQIEIFYELCVEGNIIKCQQFYNERINTLIPSSSTYFNYISNHGFTYVCIKGNLEIIQWLIDIYHSQYNYTNDGLAFKTACKNGHLDFLQKLYKSSPNINIREENEEAFRNACMYNHLEVAKWLLTICPNINIHINNEWAFCLICMNGNLEFAKWLLSMYPKININIGNERPFRYACLNNNIELVKWLLEVSPNIDVHAEDEYAFRNIVCKYGFNDIIKLLHNLNPYHYSIKYDTNDILIALVRNPFDRNWEQKRLILLGHKKKDKVNNLFTNMAPDMIREICSFIVIL